MDLWEYTACLYLAFSSAGFMRQVFDDEFRSAPMSVAPREVLLVLTAPATMALFCLPFYAFFIMSWWQPIVGFLAALWLSRLITDRLLAGTTHAYTWAIVFSLVTALVFAGTVLR